MGRMGLCCWNGSEGFSVFSWGVKLFLRESDLYMVRFDEVRLCTSSEGSPEE
jgi:hypothetical protein